jgi:hypothetical protein
MNSNGHVDSDLALSNENGKIYGRQRMGKRGIGMNMVGLMKLCNIFYVYALHNNAWKLRVPFLFAFDFFKTPQQISPRWFRDI